VCDGTVQQVRVVVVPTQRAFKKGPAVGQATLMVCTGQIPTCQPDLVDRRAIQIVKP
jgi:hypothetical protein